MQGISCFLPELLCSNRLSHRPTDDDHEQGPPKKKARHTKIAQEQLPATPESQFAPLIVETAHRPQSQQTRDPGMVTPSCQGTLPVTSNTSAAPQRNEASANPLQQQTAHPSTPTNQDLE
ncbi:hypothetical protein M404DRAFT_451005 [Pisolithus tinctorius Marx 270]|uniref:Uncharacterized protein n=1 Tax=Pisolithus tinctorius Marx 270 TaxID=870435 RepID=A0A0C3PIH3_PISTI|nr:hypothetical protein M404DRAFT_451005 [Pisolithus tinctorius Marx 270]